MRKLLTMTDVTRMKGSRVCIAGIDSDGVCIRPDLPPPGLLQGHLQVEGHAIIKPRAKIEFELQPKPSAKPHTEDMFFEADTWRHVGDCDDNEWYQLLDRDAAPSVEAIFQGALQEHKYVLPGEGARSLGTIRVADVHDMQLFNPYDGSPRPRLRFSDAAGVVYDLPITDLAYRDWAAALGADASRGRHGAAAREVQELRKAQALFLRVGLTRPFDPGGGTQEKCWLQITGICPTSQGITQNPEKQDLHQRDERNRELLLEQETNRLIAALNDNSMTWDEARAWQRQLEVLAQRLKEALEETVLASLPAGKSLSTDAYKFEHKPALTTMYVDSAKIRKMFSPQRRPDLYKPMTRRAYLRVSNPEKK